MRPSQYHYIKRAVTRTAYNRKMQKKREFFIMTASIGEEKKERKALYFSKEFRESFCTT